MPTQFESKEILESDKWNRKSNSQKLKVSSCIAIWTDVCGFGDLLQKNNWDLNKLQNDGIVPLLSEVYSIAGRVSLPNIAPLPSDRIMVLNDGVAKTVDLEHKDQLEGHSFLYFISEIIHTHYILLGTTKSYNVGIRTILAGGERIQYSPEKITGESILTYDENNISEHGKKILDTQFLYNPAEFQMNTAFAKAFTIDTLGTKEGIVVNGFFVEKTFVDLISGIPDLEIKQTEIAFDIYFKDKLMFKLHILKRLEKIIKGLKCEIFQIDKFFIFKEFDGESLDVILF